jgi:predicted nucleotidyltransferase
MGCIVPNMGINSPKTGKTRVSDGGIAGALFSHVQQRLLALIFGHPETSFYMSEIVQTLRSGTGAVERQLARLEGCGLVSVARIGNQKHYRANREAPIFQELYGIVQKTMGLADPLRRALQPFAPRIKAAFVYGSVAKGTDTSRSDIDLMVIGDDLTYSDLFSGLEQAVKVLARPVNPTILDPSEWMRKRTEGNSFIENVAGQPKIFVFGSEADLNDEPKSR